MASSYSQGTDQNVFILPRLPVVLGSAHFGAVCCAITRTNTSSALAQCLRYVVEHDFFDDAGKSAPPSREGREVVLKKGEQESAGRKEGP